MDLKRQSSYNQLLNNYAWRVKHLTLRTVCQDVKTLESAAVSCTISSVCSPEKSFIICQDFTAQHLALSEHSNPVTNLQHHYPHLRRLHLQQLDKVTPLLLIGADYTNNAHPTYKVGPSWYSCSHQNSTCLDTSGPVRDFRNMF